MTSSTLPAAAPSSPVEAYCCTGTSPGRMGRAAFAELFDPEASVRLSESIDLHAVDPAVITAPTTLVLPWLVDELTEGAPGVERHITLSSVFGHDAFLKEVGLVSNVIRSGLPSSEAAR